MVLPDIITANYLSAALRFALAIVANSLGDSAAQQVGSAMLFYPQIDELLLLTAKIRHTP